MDDDDEGVMVEGWKKAVGGGPEKKMMNGRRRGIGEVKRRMLGRWRVEWEGKRW